jgi:hypothetical protein
MDNSVSKTLNIKKVEQCIMPKKSVSAYYEVPYNVHSNLLFTAASSLSKCCIHEEIKKCCHSSNKNYAGYHSLSIPNLNLMICKETSVSLLLYTNFHASVRGLKKQWEERRSILMKRYATRCMSVCADYRKNLFLEEFMHFVRTGGLALSVGEIMLKSDTALYHLCTIVNTQKNI